MARLDKIQTQLHADAPETLKDYLVQLLDEEFLKSVGSHKAPVGSTIVLTFSSKFLYKDEANLDLTIEIKPPTDPTDPLLGQT